MLLVVVVLNVAFLLDRSFLTLYARVYFCVFLLSFLYVITLTNTLTTPRVKFD